MRARGVCVAAAVFAVALGTTAAAAADDAATRAPRVHRSKTAPRHGSAPAQRTSTPTSTSTSTSTSTPTLTPTPTPSPTPTPVVSPAMAPIVAEDASRDTVAAEAPVPRPTNHVGQEFLQVSVGIEGGMRHFAYNDGVTGNLRPYTLNAAPLATAGAEVYPLAGEHVVDFGAVIAYERAFAVQSATVDAGRLETRWSRTSAGGRARVRTGPVETAPVLGLTGAYGEESFAIESSNPNAALPSVDYRFVRVSADARVPIGRFAVFGEFGYLAVLAAGDVAARFPKASVAGVEADLGGSVAIAWGLEARVTASYRRFFYSMNPTPGDAYVAGGALDELAGVQAGLAYVY